MSSITYAIVFSGEIVDGFQIISVKAHLAKLLKADVDKMAVLFSGKPVVIKRTTDKQEALKYGMALKKVGADVKIKAIKTEATAAQAAPAGAASSTGGLSLAPNKGYLVEPRPAPPPLDIDLSGLSLAEDIDAPLSTPEPPPIIELDLSEYSVSEMDGAPLVEPKPAPPRLEAPDFSLDEPGVLLQELKEEKKPVLPDTSNLTLAEPGTYLLLPSERAIPPAPFLPNTSNLQLVPNPD